jgi:hypothetical protein
MGKLIDFNTKQEIIIKPLSIEDTFIEDLITLLNNQTPIDILQETLFNKYTITLK